MLHTDIFMDILTERLSGWFLGSNIRQAVLVDSTTGPSPDSALFYFNGLESEFGSKEIKRSSCWEWGHRTEHRNRAVNQQSIEEPTGRSFIALNFELSATRHFSVRCWSTAHRFIFVYIDVILYWLIWLMLFNNQNNVIFLKMIRKYWKQHQHIVKIFKFLQKI